MATWTTTVDRSDGYVVGASVWNGLLGTAGNIQYLYDAVAYAYKTSAQQFTTNTTLAAITASVGGSGGNFTFSVLSGGKYFVKLLVPNSFGGTGGMKMRWTGPAASNYYAAGQYTAYIQDSAAGALQAFPQYFLKASATAASTFDWVGINSGGTTNGNFRDGLMDMSFMLHAGADGTMALSGAQNSSNSTTDFGTGMMMFVYRVA